MQRPLVRILHSSIDMIRTCTRIVTLLLGFVVVAELAACQERGSAAQPDEPLRTLVESKALETAVSGPQMTSAERARLADQVRRFYRGVELSSSCGSMAIGRRPGTVSSPRFSTPLRITDCRPSCIDCLARMLRAMGKESHGAGGSVRHQSDGEFLPLLSASDGRPARPSCASIVVDAQTREARSGSGAHRRGQTRRARQNDGTPAAVSTRIS